MVAGDYQEEATLKRYRKFLWQDLSRLPQIGVVDHVPKNKGAFRFFETGNFAGEHLAEIPVTKVSTRLTPLNKCVYCGYDSDLSQLTEEHIVPEFLGAGLSLPNASCSNCQKITSAFEGRLAQRLFNPVRKEFGLIGKNGNLQSMSFPLNIGTFTNEFHVLPLRHYPTILVMPFLFPAASYSRSHPEAYDIFNIRIYNLNANPKYLERYAIDLISTQTIDLVELSQLIAKIAHCYAIQHWGWHRFKHLLTDFIRTEFLRESTKPPGHFANVGCIWDQQKERSKNLHEIELGMISWQGKQYYAARVQLFACCGMPSYHVTVGERE